jgi:hypothetical protein
MTFVARIMGAAVICAATLLGSALSVPPAQAAYTVTLEQDGLNVVADGSGTLDVTDLSFLTSQSFGAQILPTLGEIFTGPASSTPNDQYHGVITGPASFGSGSGSLATSGAGDLVGIGGLVSDLLVPADYTSGTSLSDMSTYDNATFASLGVTPGTYEWTWGSGAHADSFTLDAVPAPLIGHGLPVLLAVGGLLFGANLLGRAKREQEA